MKKTVLMILIITAVFTSTANAGISLGKIAGCAANPFICGQLVIVDTVKKAAEAEAAKKRAAEAERRAEVERLKREAAEMQLEAIREEYAAKIAEMNLGENGNLTADDVDEIDLIMSEGQECVNEAVDSKQIKGCYYRTNGQIQIVLSEVLSR